MAGCVNDTAFSSEQEAKIELTKLAESRIKKALSDLNIINGSDPQLNEVLVWDPLINVENQQN